MMEYLLSALLDWLRKFTPDQQIMIFVLITFITVMVFILVYQQGQINQQQFMEKVTKHEGVFGTFHVPSDPNEAVRYTCHDKMKEESKLRIMTREEVQDATTKHHYFTAGQLRKNIEGVPDDTPVMVERVEDRYFNTGGWGVYLVEGEFSRQLRDWNAKLSSGEITPDEYPGLCETPNNPLLTPHTEQEIADAAEQFISAWYGGYHEKEKLFLLYQHY